MGVISKTVGEGTDAVYETLMRGLGLEDLRYLEKNQDASKKQGVYVPRGGDLERAQNLETVVERTNTSTPDQISIVDLEGRPFITTMSDRTDAGGLLARINGVDLADPVRLLGGQDYMFNNDDHVWASAKSALSGIMNLGKYMRDDKIGRSEGMGTGQNPILIPWRMAPTGSDFASMTGETMLKFAQANMGASEKKALNSMIKESIPNWKGVDNPESITQFEKAPDAIRKKLKSDMDVQFRNEGGLSLGEARLSIAQPSQINAKEGNLQNVAMVDLDKGIGVNPRHPSYPFYISGEPMGTLKEDIPAYFLDPRSIKQHKGVDPLRYVEDPMNPTSQDLRSLQMGARGGIITDKHLKNLQRAGIISSPSVVGGASLLDAIQQDNAQVGLDSLMGQYDEFMDRNPDIYNYGEIAPIKRNVVSGDYSLAVPTMFDEIVKGLLDIGQSRKTGVVNSSTSLLDAIL